METTYWATLYEQGHQSVQRTYKLDARNRAEAEEEARRLAEGCYPGGWVEVRVVNPAEQSSEPLFCVDPQ